MASSQEKQRHRSIFQLPPNFFDSCRLLPSPHSSLPTQTLQPPSNHVDHIQNAVVSGSSLTCNTCNAHFDSVQDQRSHFKSDIHRFNVKLTIAGKNIVKEEDFEDLTSDFVKDCDVSSISGSESDDDSQNESRGQSVIRGKSGESFKQKLFVCLQTGQRVSVWKCLIMDVSENVLYDDVEMLKSLTLEPRDNTRLRSVLLASGGHFAGCVFDGDTLVAHKTFHRYAVRAKAGKKQSSKDASGRTVHSAGASLHHYNELALKKEVRELLTAWRPYFDASISIFIHAPSSSRQLLYDGEKPCFTNPQCVRNIAMIVCRPTLREAKRVYGQLTLVSYEADEKEILQSNQQDVLPILIDTPPASKVDMARLDINAKAKAYSSNKNDEHVASSKVKSESELPVKSTPLHQAVQSRDAVKVMELLEQGLDPCIKDERGQTPYMLAPGKQIKKIFRRFMASNLDKWDWKAAQVFSPLTKEMEESQAAMKAERKAERRARAKELKEIREAEEKKAQAEAAEKQVIAPTPATGQSQPKSGAKLSKEEEIKRAQDAEREKRAAATERRMAVLKIQANSTTTSANSISEANTAALAGRMSPLNEAEFKTYLAKAREKRAAVLQSGAAEAKLDVSGVTIRKLKRKVGGNSKEGSPSLSHTEPIAAQPLNNVAAACGSKVVLPSPRKRIKKEKTCVPMEETDIASLWDRRFDGMGFVNENLSLTKDVQEVKESGLEKASEMLVAYSLRSALLGKVITDQFRAVLVHESNCQEELNTTKEKLKIASDTLEDMKKQILKVNQRLEEEQTALTQLEKKNGKSKAFEEDVVGLKKSINTLKGQSTAKDMEIEDLKKSIDTLKGQSAAKDMEIEDLKKSIATLKGQSAAKDMEIEDLKKMEIEDLKRSIDTLKGQSTAKDVEIEDLKKSIATLKGQSAAKDMEIEDLKKSIDTLKGQSTAKDMEIEDLKKSIATLKGQSTAKDMEIEDLKIDAALRYQDGFDKAIEQVRILFPSFDLSEADAMKSVVDGKLV